MAGDATGYLCLQVPGRVHLTIIPLRSQSESSQFSNPTSRFHRGGLPAGRKDLLSREPCVWFPGWLWRRCCVETFMAEPVKNHCYVDTLGGKAYRRGMPKFVR